MRALCWTLLLALTASGCFFGGDGEDECSPGGEKIAEAHQALATLTGDDEALYYLDWEDTDLETSRGVTLVTRLAKDGGEPEVLVRSDAEEAYAKKRIAVDATHVYYLDHCIPAAPTCARLFRVPSRGGDPELLVEDRVHDFMLRGDTIVYSTSDENGLQEGEPDGSLWSLDKAGGEPEELASGLYHLRDVELDAGDAIYFTDTEGPDLGPWRLRRLGAAEPVSVFPTTWFGPPIVAQDDRYLFLLADLRIVRVPKQGGDWEPASPPREYGIAAATAYDGVLYGADAGLWWSEGDDGPSHYECGAVVAVIAGGSAYQELAAETEEASAIWVDDRYVFWTSYRGAIFQTPR
ncbi:MAG TPA: hypothetical protein VFU21_00565 [Kofleriaceae bacterium]|nr:hypothetical protein [Kofleriaceae bacterium]